MKTLTIRQVPDQVHEALRIKAARAGCSMEEFMRREIVQIASVAAKKPDFTKLRELQMRVAEVLPADSPSAAQIVREMRDDDNAAVDAKWARMDADLQTLKARDKIGKQDGNDA